MTQCRRITRGQFTLIVILGATLVFLYLHPKNAEVLGFETKIVDSQRLAFNPSPRTEGGYDVILNSYMRSGSTLLGEILGHRDDTFYFYEPLWRVRTFQYYKNADLVCEYKTPECVNLTRTNSFLKRFWRQFTTREVRLPEALQYLQSIYNCDFYKYPHFVQVEIHTKLSLAGKNWKLFERCLQSEKDISACLYRQSAECGPASHRVSKILRMSPGNLAKLLDNNPRLKLVQLFRDPRSVVNSHLNTEFYHLSSEDKEDVRKDVTAFCTRLNDDIVEAQALNRMYPNRVKIVRYEDFTKTDTSIEVIEELFNFVNMTMTKKERKEIMCKICHKNHCCGSKTNASKPVLNFRDTLEFDVIRQIDLRCAGVFKALGYVSFKSLKEVRNRSISTFIAKPVLDMS